MKRRLEESDGDFVTKDDATIVNESHERGKCPYLDTIDRHVIDFDSEKLCSVTLTNMNVCVCLVCGKYFQGRGKSTPAYTHPIGSFRIHEFAHKQVLLSTSLDLLD